mgnify:CR=1 FL=1
MQIKYIALIVLHQYTTQLRTLKQTLDSSHLTIKVVPIIQVAILIALDDNQLETRLTNSIQQPLHLLQSIAPFLLRELMLHVSRFQPTQIFIVSEDNPTKTIQSTKL